MQYAIFLALAKFFPLIFSIPFLFGYVLEIFFSNFQYPSFSFHFDCESRTFLMDYGPIFALENSSGASLEWKNRTTLREINSDLMLRKGSTSKFFPTIL